MFIVMTVLIFVFLFMVFYITRWSVFRIEQEINDEVLAHDGTCRRLLKQKDELIHQRRIVERAEAEIFLLYDLMRDLSKAQSAEEAFEIFKEKMRRSLHFESCAFEEESVPIEEDDGGGGRFVFPIKSRRKEFGYLVLKGLWENERDKTMILASQYALALRRIRLYEEIEDLATIDGLTEVFTRRYFLERFSEEIKRSQARGIVFSLLLIDVDHFKRINDRYGHLTGDQILRQVGDIIRKNLREIDFAGRYGGEEFAVILPDTDLDGANFAAERIRAAAGKKPIEAYDIVTNVSLSIGISTFPENGQTVEELVDKADWALYCAKKQGRNRICPFGFSPPGGK